MESSYNWRRQIMWGEGGIARVSLKAGYEENEENTVFDDKCLNGD